MLLLLPTPPRAFVWLLAGVALAPASGLAASLTGVCPDGSIYIVQEARQIPCADAKAVTSDEVPPIRPEYLPTPYTWKVWNERNSPNNPYNVIDAARQARGLAVPPQAQGAPGVLPPQAAGSAPAPPQAAASAPAPASLGLSEAELRDLFQIVELSQEQTPARLARETASGQGVFEVSFARSTAFEELLRERFVAQRGFATGGVLLFAARSVAPEEFYASFTFLQQHLSYQPDATDERQLGVLQGRLGALAAGEVVLGYVTLPPNFDAAAELDIYWDDRHTTVQFGR
jgi:hypothetical protein